jgi:hypothetical protein
MQKTLVFKDVEGDLVHVHGGGPPHLAKCLSISVAWQVFDLEDLTHVEEATVTSVETDLHEGLSYLHYRPAIEVFPGMSLRGELRLEGSLGPWLAAGMAYDLCRSLKTLHEEDIPQLVLHPERIGRLAGRFVLLPTLAGVLPPLSRMPSNEAAGWLHYVAPEVLRTRGIDKALLFAADVYAWGRMMHLLCAPDWQPDLTGDAWKLAEQRVERPESESLPPLPAGFATLAAIWSRAAALPPAQRPSLDELLKQLQQVREEVAPEEQFARLLRERKLAEAERLVEELEQACRAGHCSVPQRTFHLMAADLHMARTPPDPGRAIIELDLAESREYYEADVQIRLARAYLHFTGNDRHLWLSSKAYERAARLQGWNAEVLDEWMPLLQRLEDPDYALEVLARIPTVFHTRRVSILRIECLLRKREYGDAWREVAALFPGRRFDREFYELARRVAQCDDPEDLLTWSVTFQGQRGFAAPLAAAWEVLGDETLAEMLLQEARAYQPEQGE